MIHTEKEAKDKTCCRNLSANCIASECMAWRWIPLKADNDFVEAVKQAAEELGDRHPSRQRAATHVAKNRAKYGLPEKPFSGYCGLAGKPYDHPL